MREAKTGPGRNVGRLGDFREILQNQRSSYTPVAVVNQVARLYRVEQVSQFLERALALSKDRRDSA
jgi:hypothetical protein